MRHYLLLLLLLLHKNKMLQQLDSSLKTADVLLQRLVLLHYTAAKCCKKHSSKSFTAQFAAPWREVPVISHYSTDVRVARFEFSNEVDQKAVLSTLDLLNTGYRQVGRKIPAHDITAS